MTINAAQFLVYRVLERSIVKYQRLRAAISKDQLQALQVTHRTGLALRINRLHSVSTVALDASEAFLRLHHTLVNTGKTMTHLARF